MKLIVPGPETGALRAVLGGDEGIVSSALLTVEAQRAAARYGGRALARARATLMAVTLVPLDDPALQAAAEIGPSELRSLDALHLAAALSLGADLGRFFCYDERLGAAAAARGVDVRSPA